MKLAIVSDIHDNLPRLNEALTICRHEKLEICVCCGDVGNIETLNKLSETFRKIYLALGNLDFSLKSMPETFPKNVEFSDDVLKIKIDRLSIAIVHNDYIARGIADKETYDVVFYGHTHTPWERRVGKTTLINPGEITGQYGKASFAIFDTNTLKSKLILIN